MTAPPIPQPRPSDTLTRVRGRFLNGYMTTLAEMNRWQRAKDQRKASLRAYYAKQRKDHITIEALVDADQEVKECQILLDRATARAAALGPAALLEAQGHIT